MAITGKGFTTTVAEPDSNCEQDGEGDELLSILTKLYTNVPGVPVGAFTVAVLVVEAVTVILDPPFIL
ncbi:hypothetical protein MCEGE10_01366 [Flavobacteriaceae bacterium]